MTDLIVLTSDRTAPVQAALKLGLSPIVITAERYRNLHEPAVLTKTLREPNSVDAVVGAIREVISVTGAVPILAATEKTIPLAGIARTLLGLPGMSADTAVAFTNKSAMKARWESTGVPTAPSRSAFSLSQAREYALELGLPVVTKPTFGAGGRGTTVASDLSDLAADGTSMTASQTGVTVERLLSIKTEYHVDSVVRGGEVVESWASQYFSPLGSMENRTVAGSYLLRDDEAPDVLEFNERAVAAMGIWDGVTHFECFDAHGELLAGEVACRPAGAGVPDVLQRARGVDLWDEFVRAGMSMSRTPASPQRSGAVQGWMYFPRDPTAIRASHLGAGVLSVRTDAPGSATHILNLEAEDVRDMEVLHAHIAEEV